MQKNILVLAIIAFVAYLVGMVWAKASGKSYEDLRLQLERLCAKPGLMKSPKQMAERAWKSLTSFLGS